MLSPVLGTLEQEGLYLEGFASMIRVASSLQVHGCVCVHTYA